MSIHQNLRRLRAGSGMTQEQVAEQLGITRQALSSYESGRTRPDIDMLLQMCRIYRTDLDGIVYGENETLRWGRWVKNTTIFVGIILLALTVTSSGLLWSAHTFFPLTEGQMERPEILEAHLRLADAWETIDGLAMAVALIGFFALLLLSHSKKNPVQLREKLLYMAALAAGIFLLPLPFALTDPVFAPVNYLITPALVVARMVLFFAIDFLICLIKSRKKHRMDQTSN